jgi:hypothetical protein
MSPHAPTPGRKRSGTGRAGPALEALLDGGTQPLTETDKPMRRTPWSSLAGRLSCAATFGNRLKPVRLPAADRPSPPPPRSGT